MDLFKGEADWIDQLDVDGPIADVSVRWPEKYVDAYAQAAAKAKAEGHSEAEVVYGFMQQLLSIHPSYESSTGSYVPMMSNGIQRTPIPSDFTEKDVSSIHRIIARTNDIALKARLYDLLFVSTGKDFRAAASATPLMLEAAEALAGTGEPVYLKEGLLRSLQLAKRIGWTKEIGEKVRETIIRVARKSSSYEDDIEHLFILRLVRDYRLGDAAEWRDLSKAAAEKKLASGNQHHAEMYGELVVAFSQILDDVEGEQEAWRIRGEAFVDQAKARASGDRPSFMAAAGLLRSGIEALRRGSAPKERVEELQTLLRDYQSRNRSEMFATQGEMDISKVLDETRNHVSGKPFGTALLHLAFGATLVDPGEIRQRVLHLAKEHPLLFLFDTQILDRSGKTRQVQRGILDLEGEEYEKALRLKMIAQAALMEWGIRAQAQIEPARNIVFTEHHPTKDDLVALVLTNPFIPPGHEGLILRGILAGFEGDYVTASHLLVPQFEACFRYVLEAHGVHLTTFKADGTEPYKLWGGMLDVPKTAEIFGEEYIFEIEGILLNEAGYNFRNKLAHGMLTESECISIPAVTCWWLMLRLCLEPVINRFQEPEAGAPTDIACTTESTK